jgi:hypothetical protein
VLPTSWEPPLLVHPRLNYWTSLFLSLPRWHRIKKRRGHEEWEPVLDERVAVTTTPQTLLAA